MKTRILTGLALASLMVFADGCKKKVAAVTPPTPKQTETQASVTPPSRPAAPEPPASTPVTAPERSNMPDAATRARIQELLDRIQDAHFDYDKHTIRPD